MVGGFIHLANLPGQFQAVHFGHQPVGNKHVYRARFQHGQGLLCAAGKVRRVTYGFVSLDSIPLEPHFRRARETASIAAREWGEGLFLQGLRAAAWKRRDISS